MNKANMLKTLGAGLALSTAGLSHAQTTEDLYKDLHTKDGNKEISLGEVKSSLTTLSSAPSWTVINALDYGLPYNGFNSLYFDPTDSTRVLGAVGGMTVKDTTVHAYGYGGENTCLPFLTNGFSSYKDGDTLYRGTQSNGGVGGFVKQSPAGCSVNTSLLTGSNDRISSIVKFQNKLYVGTWFGGIFVLNADGTVFQQYTTTNSPLPSNGITKFSQDNQGNLWISTGTGVAEFDGSTWNVYTSANTGLNFSSGLWDVVPDNNGNVWCGNTKLFRFSGGVRSEVTVPTLATGSLQIKGIEVNQYGEVVLATKNNGVRIYNPSTGVWRVYDTNNSPLTTNRVNDVAIDTTAQDKMRIGIGSDASGFILLEESTADYLPSIPAGAHITGQDTVQAGQTYTYALSTPLINAQDYEWSYTGMGATTITPKLGGTAVEITFVSGAIAGDIILKARNNYTKPVTDTVQLTFTIHDITTGIDEQDAQENVVVAPNPTVEMISLLGIERGSVDVIEIYDMTGKLVKKHLVGKGEEVGDINVQDLAPGAYMILAKNTKDMSAFPAKFIKK